MDPSVRIPRARTITVDFRLDWERLGVVLATFGIACAGLATVLYSTGFLIQALSHHS
jgi:hypothetical protein